MGRDMGASRLLPYIRPYRPCLVFVVAVERNGSMFSTCSSSCQPGTCARGDNFAHLIITGILVYSLAD